MQAATDPEAPVCSHYKRGCRVLAPCCNQWVGCRLCHNQQILDHEIDRHAIRTMQCLSCDAVQPCARECAKCAAVMGDYFCRVCNLFDHDGAQKQVFHCDECGICRVGGRENYYHCARCCGCYPHSLNNRHRCVDGSMHRECAICLERTFDSIQTVNVLSCGHVLHHSCYREYVRYGNVVCPTCRTSLLSPRDQQQRATNGAAVVDPEANQEVSDDEEDESGSSDEEVEIQTDAEEEDSLHEFALRLLEWGPMDENDVEGLEESDDDDDETTVGRRR